jgi:Histidine kinase-, DNA gyrase B-, and HSP90-like ATPase
MENWDPLDIQGSATAEIAAAAKKREIKNILKSYVGFFDPFCELVQNALDAVDLRENLLKEENYKKKIWIEIDLKKNTLIVTDNGIGFNETQFRTFLTPSISFKNSKKTRGNKGVGATYLAYGFNNLGIETKTPLFTANTEILNGRAWVDDDDASVARPTVRSTTNSPSKLEGIDRGSSFFLKFEGNVRPKSLDWIGATSADQWKVLLLIKTPLGQITQGDLDTSITFDLIVTDKEENVTSLENQNCDYIFPHKVVKACVRSSDITKEQATLLSKGKDAREGLINLHQR